MAEPPNDELTDEELKKIDEIAASPVQLGAETTPPVQQSPNLIEEFNIQNCVSIAGSPLPQAVRVRHFSDKLELEIVGMRSGKIITFNMQKKELMVEWPQRNIVQGVIVNDPDPLIIPIDSIQWVIFSRDEPGKNPLMQGFSISIQEKDESEEEILAGDSRILRIANLISDFLDVDFSDETHIETSDYGFEIPVTNELPVESKILVQDEGESTTFVWVHKGDLLKFWGGFAIFTLFFMWFINGFFSSDFFQLTLALLLWFFVFRTILGIPKVFYSKIILNPEYISFIRTPRLEDLNAMPKIPVSSIENIRLTMVTNTKPGIEIFTKNSLHWLGYDIAEEEIGYIYNVMLRKLDLDLPEE